MHGWLEFAASHEWAGPLLWVVSAFLSAAVIWVAMFLLRRLSFVKVGAQARYSTRPTEEQIRPVLQIERSNDELYWRSPAQRIVLRNVGVGPACNTAVELFGGKSEQSLGTYFGFEPLMVSPGQTIQFAFPTNMACSLLVVYQSVRGERYATSIKFLNGEAHIQFQQDATAAVSAAPFIAGLVQNAVAAQLYGGPLL